MTRPGRPGDRGESLVELLVSMVVIGLAGAAILGAMAVGVAMSTGNRDQARVQAALRDWAEELTAVRDSGGYAYTPCATPSSFPSAPGLPSGWSASVVSVRYWDAATSSWSASCGSDSGLQRLALQVSAPGGLFPASIAQLDVVVRRPCAGVGSC